MCAEDEFKLKKDRIDVSPGEEKRVIDEVVIVLQSDFRELSRIPGQVRADPGTRLSIQVVGISRVLSIIIIAAKACDLAPIDTVHLAVKDEAGFREDAARGLHLGFEGKLCIHPRQVEIANAVFTPGPAQIEYARRVIAAWEDARASERGVFTLDGKMIDAPLVAVQRRVLERARRAGALPDTSEA